HGGLIAAAGTDLEYRVERAAVSGELGHPRHDPWLRDRLSLANRQRCVVVRANLQCFVDEDVTWNGVHRGEHDLVADAVATQPVDHAGAGAIGRHADARMLVADRPHRSAPPTMAAHTTSQSRAS